MKHKLVNSDNSRFEVVNEILSRVCVISNTSRSAYCHIIEEPIMLKELHKPSRFCVPTYILIRLLFL